ncbi:uncharacterized protein KY384_005990 [Bacidia gigantensis]|uniref:uncharacterized protein n=1 Tax=Bacidia gigantensis TaxID=2732470 RepID=UPI001D053715|nr:uncharacterized protein KY384_005990 [Bacidia gigantensis]KAG8529354.1 hypothetical protein KY384_005990 [Bacidia gigantensis]
MAPSRRSARQAAKVASSPASSQSNASPSAGAKRKAAPEAPGKPKRGKKTKANDQSTIEASMPTDQSSNKTDATQDVEMNDIPENKIDTEPNASDQKGDESGAETARKVEEMTKSEAEGEEAETANGNDPEPAATNKEKTNGESTDTKPEANANEGSMENGFDKLMSKDDAQPKDTPEATGSKVSPEESAVEDSAKREEAIPSNLLEKGIIYFFFRGRVGMDEPGSVSDIARSYIVLRPLQPGAKLGEGPIGDDGNNRMLALPKKVLPMSPKDRFMTFVEQAKLSMDAIKERLSSSDYATKTAGVRHTPAAAPIGEGVYAITQTGRETHLAYILTIPDEIGDIQKDVGLRQRGSYITSAKNPQSSGTANAQLPQGAEYPDDIQKDFGGRGWMPLHPKLLDFNNTQFLLIGHGDDSLEKATKPQNGEEEKAEKETP